LTRYYYGYILKIGKVVLLTYIKKQKIMPRFDGSGPSGYGPGSGGGRGPCGGGMGWRRGRGWFGRFWGQPKVSEKEEADVLENDAEALEQELKEIKERLAKLKGKK